MILVDVLVMTAVLGLAVVVVVGYLVMARNLGDEFFQRSP